MAHLLLSAAHKSSGKTTISMGLCSALSRSGVSVQPFKKGPDYIDPMWLGLASGRPCYNLDFYQMAREEISGLFSKQASNTQISIIEGNKGLYDGLDLDGSNSNAALAKLLDAPVILTIDARGMTRGIAPLILGYQAFDSDVKIAGVILNKLGGARHESKLRAVIEHYTDVPVIGAVHYDKSMEINERHLGLIPNVEDTRASEIVEIIRTRVAKQVDLDRVVEIAHKTVTPTHSRLDNLTDSPSIGKNLTVGIVRDSVFSFYYPDDLDAFHQCGAKLVFIDSVHDKTLPDLDGLIIGGGFPETHMAKLEANAELRHLIYAKIEAGLPVYAECGGLMYLSRSLTWNDRTFEMVGAIQGDITMHKRPQGRGYVRLTETDSHPWPNHNNSGLHPTFILGHEFHYSSIKNLGQSTKFAYRVERGSGINGKFDGIVYKNLLASYAHLRNQGDHCWVNRFLQYIHSKKG